VTTGRVYISRDVVFDESVISFQHLHPNAGALLRKEILLLDPSLHNFELGGKFSNDQHMANTPIINHAPSSPFATPQVSAGRITNTGENLSPNGVQISENSSLEVLSEHDEST
jgi:hypothetical protein